MGSLGIGIVPSVIETFLLFVELDQTLLLSTNVTWQLVGHDDLLLGFRHRSVGVLVSDAVGQVRILDESCELLG